MVHIYDSRRNFSFLADNKIEPVIKVRKGRMHHFMLEDVCLGRYQ